jgi:hypothetical protein
VSGARARRCRPCSGSCTGVERVRDRLRQPMTTRIQSRRAVAEKDLTKTPRQQVRTDDVVPASGRASYIAVEGPTGVGTTPLVGRLARRIGAGAFFDPFGANPFLPPLYAATAQESRSPALLTELTFPGLPVDRLRRIPPSPPPPPFMTIVMPITDSKIGKHQHIDMVYVCRALSVDLAHRSETVSGCTPIPVSDVAGSPFRPSFPARSAKRQSIVTPCLMRVLAGVWKRASGLHERSALRGPTPACSWSGPTASPGTPTAERPMPLTGPEANVMETVIIPCGPPGDDARDRWLSASITDSDQPKRLCAHVDSPVDNSSRPDPSAAHRHCGCRSRGQRRAVIQSVLRAACPPPPAATTGPGAERATPPVQRQENPPRTGTLVDGTCRYRSVGGADSRSPGSPRPRRRFGSECGHHVQHPETQHGRDGRSGPARPAGGAARVCHRDSRRACPAAGRPAATASAQQNPSWRRHHDGGPTRPSAVRRPRPPRSDGVRPALDPITVKSPR